MLCVGEIEAAEKAWIVYMQDKFEKESEFKNIKAQLGLCNKDGLLVCKGR